MGCTLSMLRNRVGQLYARFASRDNDSILMPMHVKNVALGQREWRVWVASTHSQIYEADARTTINATAISRI